MSESTRQVSVKVSVCVFLVLFIIITVIYYAPFFDFSKDIARMPLKSGEFATDLTPQFGIHAETWKHSLFHDKSLPHWTPYIMGGQPFMSEPGVTFVSPENILLLLFRGQLAARLSIPLLVIIGWIGLYLFLRRIGLSGIHAVIAGLIYFFNGSYAAINAFEGHLNIIHGLAYVPWLLYCAVFEFKRPWARSLWAGLVLSLMIHGGALELCLYTVYFGFPLYWLYRKMMSRSGLRAMGEMALTSVIVCGLCAVKILPALDFLSVSDRQFGMDAWTAFSAPTYREALTAMGYMVQLNNGDWKLIAGSWLLALLAIFFVLGLIRIARQNVWFALATLIVAAVPLLITHYFSCFNILWHIPLFIPQRTPDKAVFLTFLVLGLVVAGGIWYMMETLPRRWRTAGTVFQWIFVFVLITAAFIYRPPFPSMDNDFSRRENNPVLRYVRQDHSFFRLTSYQDFNQHWSWEHQTMPYGLRLLVGYPRMWHADMMYSEYTRSVGKPQYPFIPAVYNNYAAMTGLLSVKYIASTIPLALPDLELVGKFAVTEPEPLPPKSGGPYLYRNRRALPRAYQGTDTVLLLGSTDWVRNIGLKTMIDRRYDPTKVTLLYSTHQPDTDNAILTAVQHIVSEKPSAVPAIYRTRITDIETVLQSYGGKSKPVVAILCDERNPQDLRVPLRSGQSGQWIILSDTFALFNGWTAELVGSSGAVKSVPLARCNHVNTAVYIPPGEWSEIHLCYRTPFFGLGMILFALTSILMCLYMLRPYYTFPKVGKYEENKNHK